MKTQERVAFRTDVFQEIQTKMFPPLFIARKESRKDLLSQQVFPVCFGGLRKPMLILSQFLSMLSSLSLVWAGELRPPCQFEKKM